jgi:CheY-like chemotaxis protein
MTGQLPGKRILIVEDEYFIAADLRRALQRENVVVIGPTGDLNEALALARNENVDAAVLDLNLDGIMSYPVADELSNRSVPFLFLTGYDDWSLPDAYRAFPRLSKPSPTASVVRAVGQLVATQ